MMTQNPAPIPFQIVANACQKTGTRVILIGGQALGARGYQRVTLDLDFMITEQDYERLKPAMEREGYSEIVRTEIAVKMRAASDELIDIDFMFVDPGTFDGIRKEASQENFEGCNFWVPKPEHLIALKLHAIKQQPDVREMKDLNDIVELIRGNPIDPQSDTFRSLCLKFGTSALYKKILAALKVHG
ncbi:MAG: nucleotidyltransferase family protein [Candidatus Omnitrophica bacterium]|nr:nucleotidyltransferase family protein [Candidatus Omnitrophota bacterium]